MFSALHDPPQSPQTSGPRLLPLLPKEGAPFPQKAANMAAAFTASASRNTANGQAVQVCGPVADTINYTYVQVALAKALWVVVAY